MGEDNMLEMEARLRDFISGGLDTLKKNMTSFSKEGSKSFDDLNRRAKEGDGVFGKFKSQIAGNLEGFKAYLPQLLAGGVAIGTLVSIAHKSIEAFEGQEEADQKLANTLRATGREYEYNIDQLKALAGHYQNTTAYEDDMVEGAEALLLTFDKIGSDVFPRVLQASVDLAAFMGTDLPNAAQSLGQALQMPESAGRKLRAMNILLTDSETKLLQGFVDAGKQAEAQDFILKKLEGTTKGTAEATVKATTLINHFFGEVMETIGGNINVVLKTFADLLDRINGTEDKPPELTGAKERLAIVNAQIAALEKLQSQTVKGAKAQNLTFINPEAQKQLDSIQEKLDKATLKKEKFQSEHTGKNIAGLGAQTELAEINGLLDTLNKQRDELLKNNPKQTILSTNVAAELSSARKQAAELKAELAKPPAKTGMSEGQTTSLLAASKVERDSKIALMEEGKAKEIALENAKYEDLKETYKGFNASLVAIKNAHDNNLKGIDAKADQSKLEREAALRAADWDQFVIDANRRVEYQKEIDDQQTAYDAVMYDDKWSDLQRQYEAEMELHEANEQAKWLIDARYAELRKQVFAQMLQTTAQGITANLATVAGQYKKFAGVYKAFAQFSNAIDTYAGATAAYKSAAAIPYVGFLLAPVAAGAAIAAGVARGSAIASQKFEKGGFPFGRNAQITVNENGQEAVLNAQATRNLGRRNIDALNSGKSMGGRGNVQVSFGDTILQIGPGTTPETISRAKTMLEGTKMEQLGQLKVMLDEIKYYGVT